LVVVVDGARCEWWWLLVVVVVVVVVRVNNNTSGAATPDLSLAGVSAYKYLILSRKVCGPLVQWY
jgi:hypothetical protein